MIKKHAIRRTFKSKKSPDAGRHKAPKVQRLVTEVRLRRKRINKEDRIRRWKRSIALNEEYQKVYDAWANKKRAEVKQRKASRLASEEKPQPKEVPKPAPKAAVAPKVAATTKPAPKVAAKVETKPAKPAAKK